MSYLHRQGNFRVTAAVFQTVLFQHDIANFALAKLKRETVEELRNFSKTITFYNKRIYISLFFSKLFNEFSCFEN